MIIYWHKRDMRLIDNQALNLAMDLAVKNSLSLMPIMGLETDLIKSDKTNYEFSDFTQFGLLSAMLPLYMNYKHFGLEPILFCEPILDILHKIEAINSIRYLVTHQEHGTDGTFDRDKSVHEFCQKYSIDWYQIAPSGVVRNLESRDLRAKIVKEYLNAKIIPMPNFGKIKQTQISKSFDWEGIFDKLTDLKNLIGSKHNLQECSEKQGLNTLESFAIQRASGYRGGISSPNSALSSGSRLSQFLAYGSLSLRYIHQYFWTNIKSTDDNKLKSGMLAATQRLHWREHFIQRLEIDPNMPDHSINPDFDQIQYSHNLELFQRYQIGTTGEVLIDACMRCLNSTGFINFRMRAMLVSYGIFGLDLDWRELGKFLATVFLDYEPGIHWSQIQMQAGVTGINTIRVYSPHKQLLDQDSECIFVRKWIPELVNLSNEQILDYPNISLSKLTNGKYPDPIVNFKTACKLNKAKTFGIRKLSSKEVAKKVFIKHGSRKKKRIVKKLVVKKIHFELGLFD